MRNDDGVVTGRTNLPIFELIRGDCVIDEPRNPALVTQIIVVPCTEPHEAEVYRVFEVESPEYDEATIVDRASTSCVQAFDAYVGRPLGESELEIYAYLPQYAAYLSGERQVACVAADPESEAADDALTETIRGADR